MIRYLARTFLTILIVLITGCSNFPNDQEIENTFFKLATMRVPPGVSLNFVSTYRGDGDSESFSQVVVFNAVAKQDMLVEQGWLSGIMFKKGASKKNGRVELIYRRSNKLWVVTDDGLTAPPSERGNKDG